jgi:hypothetical protein
MTTQANNALCNRQPLAQGLIAVQDFHSSTLALLDSAAMALDSAATFMERVLTLGLEQHLVRFTTAKWTTFAKLAFSTKYAPGGDEDAFEKDILLRGLGDVNHEDKAEMRRLFYEAYTLAADNLKRMLINGPGDLPREVPAPEKLARRKRAAAVLRGLELKGELDISDRLMERAIEMYDTNSLSYLSLDVCTKKCFELLGGQKDKRWEQIPNAMGVLEMRLKSDDSRASLDTQFAFSFALQRRSIALFMGDVMEFALSEKLRSKYIAVLMKPPQDGYGQVTVQQILTADMIFWSEMLECSALENGTRRNANGRPCDLGFAYIFEGTEFRMAIAPRQVNSARLHSPMQPQPQKPYAPAAPVIGGPKPALTGRAGKRVRAAERNAAAKAAAAPPPGKVPKPNGPSLPKALIGMCSQSSNATGNQRFCYAFNLGSCNKASPGKACPRGLHGCMKPAQGGEACSGPHACSTCR